MSYNEVKQRKTAKIIIVTIILFVIALIAVLALTGCSSSSVQADPKASVASKPSTAPAENSSGPLMFGKVATNSEGVSVSVSNPAPYTPTDMAAGTVAGQKVVAIEFVVTNGSADNFDPTLVYATASSGGVEAAGVFDTSENIGFPPTTAILPGKTVKWTQAFSVADPADITLEVSLGFTESFIFTNAK